MRLYYFVVAIVLAGGAGYYFNMGAYVAGGWISLGAVAALFMSGLFSGRLKNEKRN